MSIPGGTPRIPDGKWPTVTAVVATRDRLPLLERAVRSIMGQSYPGYLECVVVFDQSSPVTLAARESPGRRLRMLSNTRTPGLAGARNSGIAASDCDLVAFCDDDDTWDPGKIRAQVELLESTAADFAASGVRIHHAGRIVARNPPPSVGLDLLLRSRVTALHPSTFVIRRAALDRMGLVDERLPGSYAEDYDLLLRAAQRGVVAAVPEPLADVYWHPQSFFAERWETIAEALRYLLAKYPEFEADPRGTARIRGQIAFAEAALAHRSRAWRASWETLRANPREQRAYLALAVASHLVSPDTVVRLLNKRGRGI